jgi:hypothetical protein
MKKIYLIAGLGCAMVLSLTACQSSKNESANNITAASTESVTETSVTSDTEKSIIGNAQIPNPFTDCDTLDDAAAIAGFSISLPDTAAGYSRSAISAIENEMIDVRYTDESDNEICIRKGTEKDDISGDYNEYDENSTVNADGLSVNIRGNDGLVFAASWQSGDYSYSITSDLGLAKTDIETLVSEIN